MLWIAWYHAYFFPSRLQALPQNHSKGCWRLGNLILAPIHPMKQKKNDSLYSVIHPPIFYVLHAEVCLLDPSLGLYWWSGTKVAKPGQVLLYTRGLAGQQHPFFLLLHLWLCLRGKVGGSSPTLASAEWLIGCEGKDGQSLGTAWHEPQGCLPWRTQGMTSWVPHTL